MILQAFRKFEKHKNSIKSTFDTKKQSGKRNKALYTNSELALEVPAQQITHNIIAFQQDQGN